MRIGNNNVKKLSWLHTDQHTMDDGRQSYLDIPWLQLDNPYHVFIYLKP